MKRAAAALALIVLGACATTGDIRRLENEIAQVRDVQTRRDAERARQVAEVMRLQQQMLDSLQNTRQAMRALRGDVQNDLYGIQQQLVQLGELTGQSQRRLSELRAQLERRGEEIAQAQAATDTTAAAAPSAPSAEQIYETSLGQLRLGSAGTARSGFAELLRAHPTSERVPDALYYIGQSYETENADSALAYYDQVVRNHPESPRSASALYHIGLIRERANRNAEAREAYQRVVDSYPNSDEAALARDRLRALGR
ncbi:MAG TPA: tetratricopeptide repeat protein [Gemmatimonadales bacterium]|nr:tetratricopeptide repeat protein [Gemmatimonadales bacterium]